jgi:hypothetical protein
MTCSAPVVYSDHFLQGLIDVNNANFWEGMILIVDSNCDHVYIDPQTLFESYLPATFLSLSDTPNTYTGSATYLVRVNTAATGLEFIDPLTQWRLADELVASQAGQPSGYLENILIGTAGQILVNTVWPNIVLSIDPSFITWATEFIGLTDCPHSYSGKAGMYPRVNQTETWLEFAVPPGSGYRAKMRLTSDYSETQDTDVQDAVFDIPTDEHDESDPAMFSTYDWHSAIKILESWYYLVSMRGNMKFTLWVLAGRVYCLVAWPSATYAVNDAKFWSTDEYNNHWAFTVDEMVVNYSGQTLMYLYANSYIRTGMILSTSTGMGSVADGTLTILESNEVPWGTPEKWHMIQVTRFSY